jgi:hypothetical protein
MICVHESGPREAKPFTRPSMRWAIILGQLLDYLRRPQRLSIGPNVKCLDATPSGHQLSLPRS